MLEFLNRYQKFIMIFLQGACFFEAFLILITSNLCIQRKIAIFLLNLSAVIYLGAPIVQISYEGVAGDVARRFLIISKFLDYLSPLIMLFSFNLYLRDLLSHKIKNTRNLSLILMIADIILTIGVCILVLSQFTGYYYFFDEYNNYNRSKGRIIATIIPAACVTLQIATIYLSYRNISKRVRIPLILFLVIPMIASVVSLLTYGFYLTNISTVFMAIVLYVFVVQDSNETIEHAHKREVEILENYKRELEIKVEERTKELRIANEKAENLLLNILPEPSLLHEN